MFFNVCKMWDRNVLRATLPFHPPFISKSSFISLPLVLHVLYFNHIVKQILLTQKPSKTLAKTVFGICMEVSQIRQVMTNF